MKIFLYENITFRTRLNNNEVIKLLEENIEKGKSADFGFFSFLNKDKTTYYKGEVNNDKFDIKRINFHRFDLQPDINGIIIKDLLGTLLTIKLRVSGKAFALLIFGVLFAILAVQTSNKDKLDSHEFTSLVLFVFLFSFAIYIQIVFSFFYESRKLKNAFQKMFDAEIIKE